MARVNQGYYRQLRNRYRKLIDDILPIVEPHMLHDAMPPIDCADSIIIDIQRYLEEAEHLSQEIGHLLQSQKFETPVVQQYSDMMANLDYYANVMRQYHYNICMEYQLYSPFYPF